MALTPRASAVRKTPNECLSCGAQRPSWLGEPHRCVGDANLSWLAYHQLTAHAVMAWRRHLLHGPS